MTSDHEDVGLNPMGATIETDCENLQRLKLLRNKVSSPGWCSMLRLQTMHTSLG